MSRTTRSRTIAGHLTAGGLTRLHLTEAEQQEGQPSRYEHEGFALRQHHDDIGTLVVAGAYGPNWLWTLAEVSGRLEQPHVKCMVLSDLPSLGDHEVLVRWATSAELQARRKVQAERQAPLKALLANAQAEQRAEETRQALASAGQFGLF